VAAEHCLESRCIGLNEGTAFVFNLCKNSDTEEKLGLAKLNAPEISVGDSRDLEDFD
jgi:hypothetical protein